MSQVEPQVLSVELLAKAWAKADPDPQTKSQLEELLESGGDAIANLFEGHLSFGTAGLRAEQGPGPNRMNRVLVQLVTRAIVEVLEDAGKPTPKIMVGYDGRKNSNIFAYDVVGVVEHFGATALLIDKPSPTPVLSRSVLAHNADAGIMVTASHNPKQDNGYKVYWDDGSQITAPYDGLVVLKLAALLKDFSAVQIKDYKKPQTEISSEAIDEYINCLVENLSDPDITGSSDTKNLNIVYTPLHGVGKFTLEKVFAALDFPEPIVVAEQAEPDGDFPTAAFPNPEEEGALDLALALAAKSNADLLLANDPDADRLCVSLPDKSGNWQTLTGNELGVLLADYCINSFSTKNTDLVATTCVSSQLLGRMAKANDISYEETLTGFQWIGRADKISNQPPDKSDEKSAAESDKKSGTKSGDKSDGPINFIFGYEEALGYAVLPTHVRDKDGISAAVAFVNLFAQLRQVGKTPFDRLDEISKQCGLHLTGAVSIRYEGKGQEKAAAVMSRLRLEPPTQIGDLKVLDTFDYSSGQKQRPANMIAFYLEQDCRVVVRPSGTEPKLKVYIELVELDHTQKPQAQQKLDTLTTAIQKLVAS